MATTIPTTDTAALPAPLRKIQEECEKLAHTAPGDTHGIASLLQKMILDYYADVRKQAQQSFQSALVAAAIGTLFFIYAVARGMGDADFGQAAIGVVAGGLIQVISAINFFLYGRAARQFGAFHICLERTNRFLLANTLCEQLEPPLQDEVRKELVLAVMNAPMLTMDVIGGETSPAVRS